MNDVLLDLDPFVLRQTPAVDGENARFLGGEHGAPLPLVVDPRLGGNTQQLAGEAPCMDARLVDRHDDVERVVELGDRRGELPIDPGGVLGVVRAAPDGEIELPSCGAELQIANEHLDA